MFGRGWKIATVGGIPVFIDSTWVWIAVLATYSLWTRIEVYRGVTSGEAFAYAVLGAVLFFGSVFLHELAHAVAARLNGIHVQGITLVFFGGFTSARSEEKGAGPAFLISAVGPATSLTLGLVFWALTLATRNANEALSGGLGLVAWVNLFMAGFNVLPGLPLDGGRMLQALWWKATGSSERGTRVAARSGMGVGVLLIAFGLVWIWRQDLFGLWLGLIGLFIYQGARGSGQQIGLANRLANATVADAMEPAPPAVPADATLSEALDRFLRGHEGEAFPVEDQGKVIGMLSFDSARSIGADDPLRPVRDAVIPLEHVLVAHPDERLDLVSGRLGSGRAALVLREGELVGAITGRGVARWAQSARSR